MEADQIFKKVFDEARALHAFADADGASPSWANENPDIRAPRYEGDFATSTDASFLLMKGVPVPQVVMNATRISVSKALDKVMPDWAVAAWLQHFLEHADFVEAQKEAGQLLNECKNEMPVAGRFPKHDFDYRVASCPFQGKKPKRGTWVFTHKEASEARRALEGDKKHILYGVLLWQVALQHYAAGLKKHAATRKDVPEVYCARFIEFCTFLNESALRLASFGALLPMTIAVHAGEAGQGITDFFVRGGFVKRMYVDVPAFLRRVFANFFPAFRINEKPPNTSYEARVLQALSHIGQPRMGVCAAAEAIVRWANLPLQIDGQATTAIAHFIQRAKQP